MNKTDQITLTSREQAFFNAYLEAIRFTETEQPEYSECFDPDFYRESMIDCLAFYSHNECYLSHDNIEQAGHDFWLTRNGHGTGFWDRPEIYGKYAERFTKVSESFGEAYANFWDN